MGEQKITKMDEITELLDELEREGDIDGLEEVSHQATLRAEALRESIGDE